MLAPPNKTKLTGSPPRTHGKLAARTGGTGWPRRQGSQQNAIWRRSSRWSQKRNRLRPGLNRRRSLTSVWFCGSGWPRAYPFGLCVFATQTGWITEEAHDSWVAFKGW